MSLVSLANEFHAAQPGLIIIASLLGTLRQPDRITAREALLEEEAGTLTRKAIQMAKDGDTIALRLCLDTMIYPARKDRPMKFALLPINSPRDAADIMVTVAKAVAAGDVTTNEASEFAKVIETYVKAFYVAELAEWVARVEQLSDAELMRIAMGGQAAETVTSVSRLLTLRSR